jgi:hypothetical protein
VHVERDGKVITKHFADSRYASPAQARKAAMAFRDQILAEVPPPANRRGFRTVAHSNTGEVGISLTYMTRRSGERKPYITVSASPAPGKMVGRKFSIERYGYEGAVAAAKAWRAEVLMLRAKVETGSGRPKRGRKPKLVEQPMQQSMAQPVVPLAEQVGEPAA